jgi:ATP synthase protein I
MPATDDPKSPLKKAAQGRMEAMRSFGQLGSLGLSFVFAIGIGVALGLWLDRLTGWTPWGFITFFILGFAAGVLNVYRTISRMK